MRCGGYKRRSGEQEEKERFGGEKGDCAFFSLPGRLHLSVELSNLSRLISTEQNGAYPTIHVERAEGNRRRPRRPLRTRNEEAIIMAWRNFHAH